MYYYKCGFYNFFFVLNFVYFPFIFYSFLFFCLRSMRETRSELINVLYSECVKIQIRRKKNCNFKQIQYFRFQYLLLCLWVVCFQCKYGSFICIFLLLFFLSSPWQQLFFLCYYFIIKLLELFCRVYRQYIWVLRLLLCLIQLEIKLTENPSDQRILFKNLAHVMHNQIELFFYLIKKLWN